MREKLGSLRKFGDFENSKKDQESLGTLEVLEFGKPSKLETGRELKFGRKFQILKNCKKFLALNLKRECRF